MYRPVNTNQPKRKPRTPQEIRRDFGPALDEASKLLSKSYLYHTLADAEFEEAMDVLKAAGLKDDGSLRHAVVCIRRGFDELVLNYNLMMTRQDHKALADDYTNVSAKAEMMLDRLLEGETGPTDEQLKAVAIAAIEWFENGKAKVHEIPETCLELLRKIANNFKVE